MQQAEGNWKQFVGKIKETWGDLRNDDLDRFEGRMDQLEGYLEERTGESRAAVKSRINDISSNLKGRV
ncbi:MAG: CsbD family protein [Rhodothermales bacterium]|nr:CsbD family protein [Rhodothermales bacterium]